MNVHQTTARDCIANKTKPPGSLGALEDLAVQIAVIRQSLEPTVDPARILVFGADHGIARDGVSAFPQDVTAQMMMNFAAGGAAVCVIARSSAVSLEVVDVGVAAELGETASIVSDKVALGTQSFMHGAAMSSNQCRQAMDAGRRGVDRAHADGIVCISLGEMGIGNTTSASVLLGVLTGTGADEVTGRGTGVDDERYRHKKQIVDQTIARCRHLRNDPEALLAEAGGFEIAAIAGAMLAARRHAMPVVVDGFIVTVAALLASRLDDELCRSLVFSHQSAERGHRLALDALDATPLLTLGMRLGEGSAAALAMPLLRAAAAVMSDMASFDSAGISGAE